MEIRKQKSGNQIQKIEIRKKESENGKQKTEIRQKKYEICKLKIIVPLRLEMAFLPGPGRKLQKIHNLNSKGLIQIN